MPGEASHQMELALHIIEEHFGLIVREVATLLFTNEYATLSVLNRNFHQNGLPAEKILSSEQIRSALLILQQHNLLISEFPPGHVENSAASTNLPSSLKTGLKSGFVYRIDDKMAINRLRMPKLLLRCLKSFGRVGVVIMEVIISHGRANVDIICRETIDQLKNVSISNIKDGLASMIISQAEVVTVLEDMIKARLVITSQPFTPKRKVVAQSVAAAAWDSLLPGRGAHGSSSSTTANTTTETAAVVVKKRSRKNITVSYDDGPNMSGNGDLPMELMMMNNDSELTSAASSSETTATASTVESKADSKTGKVPLKRLKKGTAKSKGAAAAPASSDSNNVPEWFNEPQLFSTGDEADSLTVESAAAKSQLGVGSGVAWTIGWDQFTRDCQDDYCTTYVSQRSGQWAGVMVKAMLKFDCMKIAVGEPRNQSVPITLPALYELLQAAADANRANDKIKSRQHNDNSPLRDFNTLKKLLEVLRLDGAGVITKTAPVSSYATEPVYTVQTQHILQTIRKKTIHDIACDKFGVLTGRILQCLQQHPYLDQQKIGDMTILPARDARERLYRLYKEKWVDYMEITKGNVYNLSNTVFLWKIEEDQVVKLLHHSMLQSLVKYRTRYLHEVESNKVLMDISATANTNIPLTLGEQLVSLPSRGSEIEDAALANFQNKLLRLQRAMSRVDDTMMLFE